MKTLSLSLGHDSSVCLYDHKSTFQYVKLERVLNLKHAMNNETGNPVLNESYIKQLKLDLKEIENSVNILGPLQKTKHINNNNLYKEINYKNIKNIDSKRNFLLDHHYAHILSCFPLIDNFEKFKWGVCIDGHGNNNSTSTFLKNPFDYKKASIHSRLLDEDLKSSFGRAFSVMGKKMELKGAFLDRAGKLMGAQSYGKVNFNYIKSLNLDEIKSRFCDFTLNLIKEQDFVFELENDNFRNFLATWHKIAEICIIKLFKENIKNKNEPIVYSGGVVQNTVINEALMNEYNNIIFVPHCYDGGVTLGGIYFICNFLNLNLPKIDQFPYLQNDEILEKPSEKTIKLIAKFLSKGLIIGWHQGKGEIGPRALGNRSILMNPAIENGKEILNSKVKHREYWRPYAASVLEEFAQEWFELRGDSPFMMRAIMTKKEKQDIIKSVVHVDGTSRIQTVSKLNNEYFYNLISEFNKITKIPMLLNTSLNDGGFPISGSRQVSEEIFRNTQLDVLVVGNRIYYKKNLL